MSRASNFHDVREGTFMHNKEKSVFLQLSLNIRINSWIDSASNENHVKALICFAKLFNVRMIAARN